MFKAHKWALILMMLSILFISSLSCLYAEDNFNIADVGNNTNQSIAISSDNNISDSVNDEVSTDYSINDEVSTDNSHNDEYQDNNSSLSNYRSDSNVNSSNTMDNNIYYIDNSNYEEYMDYSFEENSIIYITEDIEGLDFYVEANNVTITGIDYQTLKNSHIIVYEEGSANISNLKFVSDDESEFLIDIEVVGNKTTISNVDFVDYRYNPTDEEYRVISILGDDSSITNCNFDIKYPTQHRDWQYYGAECKEIVILIRGSNNNITNCSVVLNESGYYEVPYGMIRGISLYGDYNNVSYCNLTLRGTLYCYAISCRGSHNYISYNDIDVRSIRYANAITLEGQNAYNLMENNIIYIQTSNQTVSNHEITDSAYGIIITENEYHGFTYYIPDSVTVFNVVRNNYIRGNSSHMYGIEQFGGTNTTIENNTIIADGATPMGIGIIGKGAVIKNNHIEVHGQTNQSGSSADYIKPETTGISIKDGSDNLIEGNDIKVHNGTIVNMRNERRTLIAKNKMTVLGNMKYILGDMRVNGSVFSDNEVLGNPQYSELSGELIHVNHQTFVDGVIVANSDLQSYLETHKRDSNASVAKNDSESGHKENSTDYGNNTSKDSNTTDTNQNISDTPTNITSNINQTIDTPIQNTTINQSTAPSDNSANDTSNTNDTSIIDIIKDKIEEIINNTKTENTTQLNESTNKNNTSENHTTDNTNHTDKLNQTSDVNVTINIPEENDTQINTTEENTTLINNTEEKITQENSTKINDTKTTINITIKNDTSQIPTDNKTQIPENTTHIIIEEPIQQNETSKDNQTTENQTQQSEEVNQTADENQTIPQNNTDIIVINQTANNTDTQNQTKVNNTEKINNTPDIKVNTTDKPKKQNNTNQSKIDTDNPVDSEVLNNSKVTNTTVDANVKVENSTIKNNTNESTGAGDLSPEDGDPSKAVEDTSSDTSTEAITIESILEDILNEVTSESSPTTVGVTQTLSPSSAKVLEVSPKIVSKKLTLDDLKYVVAFLLILMSSLMLGYKRVEV